MNENQDRPHGRAGAPGQQKVVEVVNTATGEVRSLTKYEVSQQKEQLLAAGFSGPGLDKDEEEETPEDTSAQ